jgi:hypothetical protein
VGGNAFEDGRGSVEGVERREEKKSQKANGKWQMAKI